MKIKEIRLYGFKSFSGETKFLLNPGITAFVGPNGSGKSNIFDALRWVFGEQSMKALRCEKTEDLIHITSDGSGDSNFTEVAVIIDNEDFFPQFGSEFEIRRRFYRNGESEFYLNRVRCRLQDIQALFLNSGTLTYSFLELSEIERIISGDTKEMFDDVSGILRYQERREQTGRRLEQTDQDLLRLEDVIGEMERSARSLKRQARQAEVYHDLKDEFKAVSLAVLKRDHSKSVAGIADLQTKVNGLNAEKQTVLLELRKLEEERQNLKNEMQTAESLRTEATERANALNNALETLAADLASTEEEARKLGLMRERNVASIREKQDLLSSLRRKLAEYEQLSKKTEEELSGINGRLENARLELERESAAYIAAGHEAENKEKTIAEMLQGIQQQRNDLAKLEITKMNKESTASRIKTECEIAEKELDANRLEIKGMEKRLDDLVEKQDALGAGLQERHDRLKKDEQGITEIELDMERRQAEMNECRVLIDTLTHRLGEPANIKEIKSNLGRKINGLFRDNLSVTNGREAVIDVCLGEILNYYVLNGISPEEVANLPEGKIGFALNREIMRGVEHPAALSGLECVTKFVELKSGMNFLARYLHNYFLVDDVARAMQLADEFPQYGFVTADGVLFYDGNIIAQRGEVGYFKITQSLTEQRKRLETLKNEHVFVIDERKRLMGDMEKTKELLEQDRTALFSLNVEKSELTVHLNEITRKIEKAAGDNEALGKEGSGVAEEISSIEERIRSGIEMIKANELQIETAKQQKTSISDRLRLMEQEINARNTSLNEIVLQEGILKERQATIAKTIEETRAEIDSCESVIKTTGEVSVAEKIEEIDGKIAFIRGEMEQKRSARADLEAQSPDKAIGEITRRQELLFDRLAQKQKSQEETQNSIMQLSYEMFQLNHSREENVKKAREEFQTDIDAFLPEEIPDLETRMNEIRERMARLGVINPLSLEAYEQEKKRLDEFYSQRNDIIAAKQSLLRSIEELDTRAHDRFIDTFSQVKEKFNAVFANFFEGGAADLLLTDPQNPLASDVEIAVRLKGKRVKIINQLSGGERTLLAVSLLLAFYLVKPAPFCILDEIDAPLDDANVVRFNRFLRDLAQRTQVVIITHNRATMEYADYLYGLTMEKLGQSKIVSTRLADLEKLDASDAILQENDLRQERPPDYTAHSENAPDVDGNPHAKDAKPSGQ